MSEIIVSAGMIDTGWQPGRWFVVVGPDGEVWAETSDEADARSRMRPHDVLWREETREQHRWRVVLT
jgi:hypothetical protein